MTETDTGISAAQSHCAEFLRLSDLYGWKLYQYLMERTTDKQLLQKLYSDCLEELCRGAPGDSREEELLLEIAERVLSRHAESEKPSKRNWGFIISLLLIMGLILVCLWILPGLLMEMGILPYVNLGYPW